MVAAIPKKWQKLLNLFHVNLLLSMLHFKFFFANRKYSCLSICLSLIVRSCLPATVDEFLLLSLPHTKTTVCLSLSLSLRMSVSIYLPVHLSICPSVKSLTLGSAYLARTRPRSEGHQGGSGANQQLLLKVPGH